MKAGVPASTISDSNAQPADGQRKTDKGAQSSGNSPPIIGYQLAPWVTHQDRTESGPAQSAAWNNAQFAPFECSTPVNSEAKIRSIA
jgi:hypothetical protein